LNSRSLSALLPLFTLMLLAVSLGLYSLSSQTTALAQPSLAEDIINSVEQETDSSSADSNVLDNNNEFGDDVPVIDQENTAEQDAVNVGAQDADQDVDQDAIQEDLNFQFGFSQQTGDFDIECPPGFILIDNGQCEQTLTEDPDCTTEGSTFNPETNQCERTITQAPECPAGFDFNPETDECEQLQAQPTT
jgi:hypothetical protein